MDVAGFSTPPESLSPQGPSSPQQRRHTEHSSSGMSSPSVQPWALLPFWCHPCCLSARNFMLIWSFDGAIGRSQSCSEGGWSE